MTKGGLPLQ